MNVRKKATSCANLKWYVIVRMQDNFHQKTKNDWLGKAAFDCTANSSADCLIPLAPCFNAHGLKCKYGIVSKPALSVSDFEVPLGVLYVGYSGKNLMGYRMFG